MKMMKSLILGTAAGLVAITGAAQAADLPVKARPVDYVKICSAYGAGFYYIPGTDICLRVGGYVFIESGYNARVGDAYIYSYTLGNDVILDRNDNRINFRARGALILDARAQSAIGTVRTYVAIGQDFNNLTNGTGAGGNVGAYLERAFIQFAGFTAGQTASFFDFGAWYSIYALSSVAWDWLPVFAYTASFGNGLSGTISIEDAQARRTKLNNNLGFSNGPAVLATNNSYGGQEAPDIIANLRVDQAWGSAQIAGALHQVRWNQTASALYNDTWGYAVLGGIEIKLPMIAPGDSITLQGVYSKGAVEFTGISASPLAFATIIGLRNTAGVGPWSDIYDAQGIPGGGVDLSTAWSANLFFRHFWQPNLRSGFWVGYNRYEPGWNGTANPGLNAPPILKIWQAGHSLIWSPAPTLDLSLDVLYSKLETDSCVGAGGGFAVTACSQSADIWSFWTRWRRNF